jgi:hypothetical protein
LTDGEGKKDDLVDKLILDVKAFVLLGGDETQLRETLRRVADSPDDDVRRFVDALQNKKPASTTKLLAIALGELVMASILVVAGAVALVPTVVGANTITALAQYFEARTAEGLSTTLLAPYVSLLEFAVGVFLVVSALYALREAASTLKEAGLTTTSGEP